MIIRLNILTLAFILLASFFIGHAQADDGAPAFLNYVQQQEKKENKENKENKEIPPAPEVSKPARARENNTAALQKNWPRKKVSSPTKIRPSASCRHS